jgi:AP endonuclease 1
MSALLEVSFLECIVLISSLSSPGAQNAIKNTVRIGGNAFALFLKSQRKWAFAPLSDDHRTQFADGCKHHKFHSTDGSIPPIVPHGSYLVNLAHTEKSRADQAYETFIDDLSRCNKMGIRLYNFHPGNAIGADSRTDALKQLAKQLNKSHQDPSSGKVVTLLETMAATGGNTIGSTFEELAEVIALIDDKTRVGVCLDTCHVFAAGYDLRTPEAFSNTINKFEKTIGLNYLKALHVNDSKAPLGSGRDLHANIGTGFLGLSAFWNLVNEPRLWGLPFILETPISRKNEQGKDVEDESIWAKEIKLLESLIGMERDSEEYTELEKNLAAQGKLERERIQAQVDKRKDSKKKKKSKNTQSDSEDDTE